jgi:hypothetical protein
MVNTQRLAQKPDQFYGGKSRDGAVDDRLQRDRIMSKKDDIKEVVLS